VELGWTIVPKTNQEKSLPCSGMRTNYFWIVWFYQTEFRIHHLREFEFIFAVNFGYESEDQVGTCNEKTWGKKSHANVPLIQGIVSPD
jgi:hypothetical protein